MKKRTHYFVNGSIHTQLKTRVLYFQECKQRKQSAKESWACWSQKGSNSERGGSDQGGASGVLAKSYLFSALNVSWVFTS